MAQPRPKALKRLYAAIFLIVAVIFLLVGGATLRWWLSPEIALIAFFCFGIAPIAFYTLFGTTIMDPGKSEQGGIIDKESPRFVDRFGAAMWPLVIATLLFGSILATWFVPQTRSMTVGVLASAGFVEPVGAALFDPSRDVGLIACEEMKKANAVRPQKAVAYHSQMEPQFGPEILDCLVTMQGSPLEVEFVATSWHDELKGDVDDDRACRLTNRLRWVADSGSEGTTLWLLKFAAAGNSPATKTCAAQALRALGQKTNQELATLLPPPDRAARRAIKYEAAAVFSAAFHSDETVPLSEFAHWSSPAQRRWALDFACESLNNTRTGLVDKKLNAFVSEQCEMDGSVVFVRICEQEEREEIVADLCGQVQSTRRELAMIEARGAIRRGLARSQTDPLIGLILKTALEKNPQKRDSKIANYLGSRLKGQPAKIDGEEFDGKDVKKMLQFIQKNGKMSDEHRRALQSFGGSDKRD